MARLDVTSTRSFRSVLTFLTAAGVLAVLLILSSTTRGEDPAPGPDLEAFQAAKQAYFRNPQEAAGLFRTFIETYRDSEWTPEAYYWLAKSLETAKADRAEVLKAYTYFLRRYPNHKLCDEATFAIAEIYRNRRIEKDDLSRALDRYEKFIKSYPDSDRVPEAWFKMGDVQVAQRQYDRALEAFGKVIHDYAESPFVVPAKMGLADCLMRMQRYDDAITGFNELLKLSLTDWDELRVRLGLLNCYLKTNRLDEALAEANRIRSEADQQGHQQDWAALSSYRMVADHYQNTKEYDKAVGELKAYIERFPNSDGVWTARSSLAGIYISAGKLNDARTELQGIVNNAPHAGDKSPPDQVLYAMYRLAYLRELEKDYPEAIRLYQQLTEKYPESQRGKQAKKRAEELTKQLQEKPAEKAPEKAPEKPAAKPAEKPAEKTPATK